MATIDADMFREICERDARESCLECLKDSDDPIHQMAYDAYMDRKRLIQEILARQFVAITE